MVQVKIEKTPQFAKREWTRSNLDVDARGRATLTRRPAKFNIKILFPDMNERCNEST